jgi:hypothetical protein
VDRVKACGKVAATAFLRRPILLVMKRICSPTPGLSCPGAESERFSEHSLSEPKLPSHVGSSSAEEAFHLHST